MSIRKIVDVFMIVGMFFSMSLHLLGMGTHKLIGLVTFILFVTHNILNRKWYKTMFRGKYSSKRLLGTFINVVVSLSMLGIMFSGVLLSKEMAAGLSDVITTGRILHNVSSYICCIGISLHIGLHLKGRIGYDDK